MTLRPETPRAETSRLGRSQPKAESSDPFDLWLRRSVHRAYDAVLEEQVPEDLLRLCSDNRTEWVAMKDRWLGTAGEERAAGEVEAGGAARGNVTPLGGQAGGAGTGARGRPSGEVPDAEGGRATGRR